MLQLVVAVCVTVAVVLFAMSNTHHVELFYVVGEPIRIRMIFLLAVAFIGGALGAFFYTLISGVMRRSAARSEREWRARRERVPQ